MLNQERREDLAACARVLSQLLYYPPNELLLSQFEQGALKAWPIENDAAEQAVELMLPAVIDKDIASLNLDYTQLFLGPGKKSACPWGSVYTDKEKCLFGESERQFKHFCQKQGIEIKTDHHEPTDHIGLIMSVLAELIDDSLDGAVISLVSQHLNPWVPKFLEQLETNAKTPFYRGVALLLRSLLLALQKSD